MPTSRTSSARTIRRAGSTRSASQTAQPVNRSRPCGICSLWMRLLCWSRLTESSTSTWPQEATCWSCTPPKPRCTSLGQLKPRNPKNHFEISVPCRLPTYHDTPGSHKQATTVASNRHSHAVAAQTLVFETVTHQGLHNRLRQLHGFRQQYCRLRATRRKSASPSDGESPSRRNGDAPERHPPRCSKCWGARTIIGRDLVRTPSRSGRFQRLPSVSHLAQMV